MDGDTRTVSGRWRLRAARNVARGWARLPKWAFGFSDRGRDGLHGEGLRGEAGREGGRSTRGDFRVRGLGRDGGGGAPRSARPPRVGGKDRAGPAVHPGRRDRGGRG